MIRILKSQKGHSFYHGYTNNKDENEIKDNSFVSSSFLYYSDSYNKSEIEDSILLSDYYLYKAENDSDQTKQELMIVLKYAKPIILFHGDNNTSDFLNHYGHEFLPLLQQGKNLMAKNPIYANHAVEQYQSFCGNRENYEVNLIRYQRIQTMEEFYPHKKNPTIETKILDIIHRIQNLHYDNPILEYDRRYQLLESHFCLYYYRMKIGETKEEEKEFLSLYLSTIQNAPAVYKLLSIKLFTIYLHSFPTLDEEQLESYIHLSIEILDIERYTAIHFQILFEIIQQIDHYHDNLDTPYIYLYPDLYLYDNNSKIKEEYLKAECLTYSILRQLKAMEETIASTSYPLIKEGILEWLHYLENNHNDERAIYYINELYKHYENYKGDYSKEEEEELNVIVKKSNS